MKDDLISRKAAIDALGDPPIGFADFQQIRASSFYDIGLQHQWERNKSALESLPPAEPERRQGEWTYPYESTKTICVCSVCGHGTGTGLNPYNYCPHCGAKMTNT